MRAMLAVAIGLLAAGPALAATEYGFFSLRNTDFVVLLAFLVFIGILFYFRVPSRIGELLDRRAASIRSDLDEARSLREEAQTLLASFERRSRENEAQTERIVAQARTEAEEAAAQARRDLDAQVARRLAGAEEQLASAEAAAVRQIRDRAVEVAVAAAAEVIAERMSDARQTAMIDRSIETVAAKLH